MNINRMDRRIRIERQSSTIDAEGAREDVWTTLHTVWAAFIPSASMESVRMRAVYTQLDATFEIRWIDGNDDGICDILAEDRIVYNRQVYEVLAVEPVRRREAARLYTKRLGDVVQPLGDKQLYDIETNAALEVIGGGMWEAI